MPGIPRDTTEHMLCLIPGSKPDKQNLHHFDNERRRAIGEEIAKLLAVGFVITLTGSPIPFLLKKDQEMENVC